MTPNRTSAADAALEGAASSYEPPVVAVRTPVSKTLIGAVGSAGSDLGAAPAPKWSTRRKNA